MGPPIAILSSGRRTGRHRISAAVGPQRTSTTGQSCLTVRYFAGLFAMIISLILSYVACGTIFFVVNWVFIV